jgi:hypothetical protein
MFPPLKNITYSGKSRVHPHKYSFIRTLFLFVFVNELVSYQKQKLAKCQPSLYGSETMRKNQIDMKGEGYPSICIISQWFPHSLIRVPHRDNCSPSPFVNIVSTVVQCTPLSFAANTTLAGNQTPI